MRKSERYSVAPLHNEGEENERVSLKTEEEPATPNRAYNQIDRKEELKQELREKEVAG